MVTTRSMAASRIPARVASFRRAGFGRTVVRRTGRGRVRSVLHDRTVAVTRRNEPSCQCSEMERTLRDVSSRLVSMAQPKDSCRWAVVVVALQVVWVFGGGAALLVLRGRVDPARRCVAHRGVPDAGLTGIPFEQFIGSPRPSASPFLAGGLLLGAVAGRASRRPKGQADRPEACFAHQPTRSTRHAQPTVQTPRRRRRGVHEARVVPAGPATMETAMTTRGRHTRRRAC